MVSDTPKLVLAKLEATYLGPVSFPAKDYFAGIVGASEAGGRFAGLNPLHYLYTSTRPLVREYFYRSTTKSFDMHGSLPEPDRFTVRDSQPQSPPLTLTSGFKLGIVNRRFHSSHANLMLRLVPTQDLTNYLLFVASTYGNSYYLAGSDRALGRVSMYQPESDYFVQGGTMVAIGRDTLFRMLNPPERPRLVVEFTTSLNADTANKIPPASVIGDSRVMLRTEGRGSARLVSEPVDAQYIDGIPYIALDMGTWGGQFPEHRSWLMNLYGSDVVTDSRRIVGFARGISLISRTEYDHLSVPSGVHAFPADLQSPGLEYSGLYEDGWLAEDSYLMLAQGEARFLRVDLEVPLLSNQVPAHNLVVTVDGKEVARRTVESGKVSIRVPVVGSGRRRVGLHFDRARALPAPDNRPVSARVVAIEFL